MKLLSGVLELQDQLEGVGTFIVTGVTKSGESDPKAFLRKGIAGDWKNHFDEECNRLYCEVAGEALAAAGYEL